MGLYTGGLIFGMVRVLVNWWAYTWGAYIRWAYIRRFTVVHNNACAIYRLAMKAFITMYKISGPTRSMIGQLPCL